MICLGAFDAVFNRQKTRTVTRSLGTRILLFNRETKLTKTVQKLSQKIMIRPSAAISQSPPEYATDTEHLVKMC